MHSICSLPRIDAQIKNLIAMEQAG
jgi:hypothetical protein